jgi:hypothetical protein
MPLKSLEFIGWHCACGSQSPRRFAWPVWNNAQLSACWNCGAPRPVNGECPIGCGCLGQDNPFKESNPLTF